MRWVHGDRKSRKPVWRGVPGPWRVSWVAPAYELKKVDMPGPSNFLGDAFLAGAIACRLIAPLVIESWYNRGHPARKIINPIYQVYSVPSQGET